MDAGPILLRRSIRGPQRIALATAFIFNAGRSSGCCLDRVPSVQLLWKNAWKLHLNFTHLNHAIVVRLHVLKIKAIILAS